MNDEEAKPVTREPAAAGQELTFEQALARLEQVINELEHGEIPLERAIALFEEGMRLSRMCAAILDEAEARIELLQKTADNAFEVKPFMGGDKAS